MSQALGWAVLAAAVTLVGYAYVGYPLLLRIAGRWARTTVPKPAEGVAATLRLLVRRLSYVNVHPYYMFLHDMVQGVEELRTSLDTAIALEKEVRGITAGFNIPAFVLDTMGGGGKRHVHSHEHYDRENGIAVFTSPAVKPGRLFYYFDPLRHLDPAARQRWNDPQARRRMLHEATQRAADA